MAFFANLLQINAKLSASINYCNSNMGHCTCQYIQKIFYFINTMIFILLLQYNKTEQPESYA